ncbi:MAG: chalcone isomerase family protein [Bdellovibrionales bacterium]|nr:chalcone isomerase family protein [Bdellovibrionales bacterium]
MKLIILAMVMFFATAQGGELKGVRLDDQRTFNEYPLVLNSMGIRHVQRFGFDIKVYIAGLYLSEKSKESKSIIDSDTPKWIVMEFVRNVDRKPLIDGWRKSLKAACLQCEVSMEKLKTFNKFMVNMRTGNKIEVGFLKDKVVLDVKARSNSHVDIESSAFSKDLLAVFIGEKNPADKRLREGLLGIREEK